ncbi:heme o synthase [Usitatibacter palustris]|uniref:Protoheme IX farnesyltransferase n=1 Tax=Usitatibacter palustris TaxID=2732487 RepID=A0A6M4H2A9_9PROT|nr:heme o synthase [Usitatibacter palustris]QJR13626.1 Protoheme IX farnesyltransferase [Usitatibacter palustris]
MEQTAHPAEGLGLQFWRLMKPRVVSLIVFTAVIGMLLAAKTVPPLPLMGWATLGIALVAGAAAAFNCLVEQKIDAAMARTRARPSVMGTITQTQILIGSGGVGGLGLAILWHAVNPLTMWLTMATFVGYAVIYTVILKPATPQNIVIGGASGAMPPVLGWAAIAGEVPYQPLLLFLIIFAWTPPHFWALALYRRKEYERAGVPMLPVTHGEAFTRLHLLLYTLILVATTLLPFATGMSGVFYLGMALVLDAVFLGFAIAIWRKYSDALAKRTFAYSIFYLAMLFAALMVDHYLPLFA